MQGILPWTLRVELFRLRLYSSVVEHLPCNQLIREQRVGSSNLSGGFLENLLEF